MRRRWRRPGCRRASHPRPQTFKRDSTRLRALSPCLRGWLDQVPEVSVSVLEHDDLAVDLDAWRLGHVDAPGNESRMLREEMIRVDEEPSRLGDNCAKILT